MPSLKVALPIIDQAQDSDVFMETKHTSAESTSNSSSSSSSSALSGEDVITSYKVDQVIHHIKFDHKLYVL